MLHRSVICFRVVIEKHPTALLLIPLPHVREHCKGNFKTIVTFNRDRAILVATVMGCRARGHVFDLRGPDPILRVLKKLTYKGSAFALQTARPSKGSARQRFFPVYCHNHRWKQRIFEHVFQRTHSLATFFVSLPGQEPIGSWPGSNHLNFR